MTADFLPLDMLVIHVATILLLLIMIARSVALMCVLNVGTQVPMSIRILHDAESDLKNFSNLFTQTLRCVLL